MDRGGQASIVEKVEVRPVAGFREFEDFLALPFRLHGNDPLWVGTLRSAVRAELNKWRAPGFQGGELELFLAWRGRRPVGRIAAIRNRAHNVYHGDRLGFFGYFEAARDPEAVAGLLQAAGEWLKRAGLLEMRGPMSPSINGEVGLLSDGFKTPPVLLTPYNPPYYSELVEAAGLQLHKELLAYMAFQDDLIAEREAFARLDRLAEAVRGRHPNLRVRRLDMARYLEETARLNAIFNAARAGNWSFVPVTAEEMAAKAADMKAIVQPELVIIAEVAGEPVGCLLALPDINPILRKCRGSLLPLGWLRLLLGRRRLQGARVFGVAALPGFRTLGVTALLFQECIRSARAIGVRFGELSWVAEDNHLSRRTIERALGVEPYKRFRVYQISL